MVGHTEQEELEFPAGAGLVRLDRLLDGIVPLPGLTIPRALAARHGGRVCPHRCVGRRDALAQWGCTPVPTARASSALARAIPSRTGSGPFTINYTSGLCGVPSLLAMGRRPTTRAPIGVYRLPDSPPAPSFRLITRVCSSLYTFTARPNGGVSAAALRPMPSE